MLEAFHEKDTEPNQALQQMIWRQKCSKVVLQQMRKEISSKSVMRRNTFLLFSVA